MMLMLRKELREFIGRKRRPSGQVIGSVVVSIVLSFALPLVIGFFLLQGPAPPGVPMSSIALFASLAAGVGVSTFSATLFPMSMGPDTIAGERERHTLETLLAGPMPARQILVGKLMAMIVLSAGTAVIAGVAAWLAVTIGYGIEGLLWGGLIPIAAALSVLVPAFFMGCLSMLFSMRAKTVKAAQQAVGYALMPVFLAPAFGVMFIPAFLENPGGLIAIGIGLSIFGLVVTVGVPIWVFTRFTRHRIMS